VSRRAGGGCVSDEPFERGSQSLILLAEAMPAEKYDFKPTDGAFKDARTFGEQLKHVACGNFAFFNEIERKTPPEHCETGGPSPAKAKPEIVGVPSRVVHICERRARADDDGQCARAGRRPLRWTKHATRPRDAGRVARIGPLRTAGHLPAYERARSAGKSEWRWTVKKGAANASKTNARWHAAHRMSANPSLNERVKWHVAHARHCACRPMPATVVAELRRRGSLER
jgi:hypothetical protein